MCATERNGKRVAVIGSGPAGLAAANDLNLMGYAVTVFEKNEAAGGLLRYGIPNFKLNKDIIDRRIKLLEQEGIEFRYNEEVAQEAVAGEFDAVILATGTPQARDLNVPGRELKGVHFALEMLAQQNRVLAGTEFAKEERVTAAGKNVLVIGGGDTGSDCIGTSHRQGALSVMQIEIMPRPADGPDDPKRSVAAFPTHLQDNIKPRGGLSAALEHQYAGVHRRGRMRHRCQGAGDRLAAESGRRASAYGRKRRAGGYQG